MTHVCDPASSDSALNTTLGDVVDEPCAALRAALAAATHIDACASFPSPSFSAPPEDGGSEFEDWVVSTAAVPAAVVSAACDEVDC